mmetsp:Transcript_1523/g.3153  ORF Transcript_1523/g.3153 Transcript_1523/m.3153 type:complete len:331 (+) Transcript_1523:209-1201(+)|eukprot:CAMPEP_0181304050 /NCGR_PEP_ID=MMETSP1101-20121128/8918_1 /TAXON_ID=46948 /ORGANISM="Rhodomonas abbreviata, Strain Caron Lab Isolate" /LENGTH=330 /DNA_ID=CAMNT_0023409731 /DNA_START=186 /DNA_END=1178 /DNA_ORIENTATION=+
MPKNGVEKASLLANDEVAKSSHDMEMQERRDLSGAIDILWQLKQGAPKPDHVAIQVDKEEAQEFMTDFFDKVKGVKDDMSAIRSNINKIKELHAKIVTEVSQTKSKEHSAALDNLLQDTSRISIKVKDTLRTIESEHEGYAEEHGKDSSQFKIHQNMHGTITKKFVELMKDYDEVQTRYKGLLRDRVARQVKLVNPNATEAEVEEAVAEGGSNIFADQLLSKADQAALNAYEDVQSKHQELMRLETSITELHQLFVDMAILVEQQGELLDNIEEVVSKAAEFTGQGVEQLGKAKDLQKSVRKKMCCIVVCFIVILMIALSFVTNFLIPRI